MTSRLLSRRDVEFLLYEWLDVTALCSRPRYADHSRETFDGALDTAERIATEVFLPHRRKSDVEEPEFDGERVHIIPEVGVAYRAFAEAGLLAAEIAKRGVSAAGGTADRRAARGRPGGAP